MGEGRGIKVKWKVLPFFTALQTKMRGFRTPALLPISPRQRDAAIC